MSTVSLLLLDFIGVPNSSVAKSDLGPKNFATNRPKVFVFELRAQALVVCKIDHLFSRAMLELLVCHDWVGFFDD
jgi:hypothetical protein